MGSQNKTKRKAMLKAFKKQRGKCHICEHSMNLSNDLKNMDRATSDHVIPKSFGGPIKGNIKAAHARCNFARGNSFFPSQKEGTGGGSSMVERLFSKQNVAGSNPAPLSNQEENNEGL